MNALFTTAAQMFQNAAGRKLVLAASTALAGVGMTGTAQAHDRDYDRRDRNPFRDIQLNVDLHTGRTEIERRRWCEPVYEDRRTQVWVEPAYRTVCDRVWVEPQYRTVCDRVWREPVTQDVCERVWVPAQYEVREFVRRERGHREIYREQVLVSPAHYEEQHRQVVVTPGRFEEVQRQELVAAGHWDNVERREVLAPGHWETHVERVVVSPGQYDGDTIARFEIGGGHRR
ncbi:MAG: hypothetical protein JWO87_4039 [Phycisphaerales bacterium]|nr:hypothetical protein [Phycisphaerales bacterium]